MCLRDTGSAVSSDVPQIPYERTGHKSSRSVVEEGSIRVSINFRPRTAALVSIVASLAFAGAAAAAGLNFAGVPLPPGAAVRANVPLNALEKSYVAEGGNAVPPYTVATLAVPPGFDPKKSWPVLVVFSSSDNHRQNRAALRFNYQRMALGEG